MPTTQAGLSSADRDRAVDATAWFSVLMHARLKEDIQRAAEAQRALERLGVAVRFRRQQRREGQQ